MQNKGNIICTFQPFHFDIFINVLFGFKGCPGAHAPEASGLSTISAQAASFLLDGWAPHTQYTWSAAELFVNTSAPYICYFLAPLCCVFLLLQQLYAVWACCVHTCPALLRAVECDFMVGTAQAFGVAPGRQESCDLVHGGVGARQRVPAAHPFACVPRTMDSECAS